MSGSLFTDPYGVRVDMMREHLLALPNEVLQKIFAIMDVQGAPRRAATLIQSIWRRTRAYLTVAKLYRDEYVRTGGAPRAARELGQRMTRHRGFIASTRYLIQLDRYTGLN